MFARITIGLAVLASVASVAAADGPKVRDERPRIFWRAKAWDGPSVEKAREWVKLPEYQKRLPKLTSGEAPVTGWAAAWLLTDDAAAGQKAVAKLKAYKFDGSESPSYMGIVAERAAAAYDWLHNHPDFDDASRKAVAAELERAGDAWLGTLKTGGPSTPFYSRVAGALAGLTTIGLALHGDSPKADEYVKFAATYLKEKNGTIRQMEDGAAGGGSYSLHHEFTDYANIVAAWRSATDWDVGKWIKENQGNWLERQMLFQMWITYPNGWFLKHGDIWTGSHTDKTQFSMQFGPITGMYRNGFGRTWMDEVAKRWGPADYHAEFAWEWFVFNDPTVEAKPLAGLGKAEVFSPKLHGIVAWRSGWEPDATIVHFVCGETVDHHASYDQGKFVIFKQVPLAIKSGAYVGYKSPHHMYNKSPWSANCVVFSGGKADGQQPNIDFDGTPSWNEWKAARDKNVNRPPTGVLTATEATDKFARAVGDLAGAVPAGCAWRREIVFLGYQYVVVLDRVKGAGEVNHRWTLHTINQPKIEGSLAVADNGVGRLFCQTLLPAKAKLDLVGGAGHEFDYNGTNRMPKGWKGIEKEKPEMQYGLWRLDVTPADAAAETVYLHVLYPTDTKTEKMPACSAQQAGGDIAVKVGELSYTFSGKK
ncbi:MAG: heparinase II/III family protein [Phycisphaerae bacterium]|nr:heparinase II/III family protein [Phycisphaerae bacterium]